MSEPIPPREVVTDCPVCGSAVPEDRTCSVCNTDTGEYQAGYLAYVEGKFEPGDGHPDWFAGFDSAAEAEDSRP